MFLDKKTLHCVVINIPFLTRSAVGSIKERSQGWQHAEMRGSLPLRQET
jgi:hypothetical protein